MHRSEYLVSCGRHDLIGIPFLPAVGWNARSNSKCLAYNSTACFSLGGTADIRDIHVAMSVFRHPGEIVPPWTQKNFTGSCNGSTLSALSQETKYSGINIVVYFYFEARVFS